MKRYRVVFSREALDDLYSSYEWGRDNWGEESAMQWYADTRNSIRQLLSSFPLSQNIAPDNEEFDVETRQMLVGRYRVLFNVEESVVTILQIRGSYTG